MKNSLADTPLDLPSGGKWMIGVTRMQKKRFFWEADIKDEEIGPILPKKLRMFNYDNVNNIKKRNEINR